jgi:hypothetical protein
MWAGVTSELIIGPYFSDVFVTGESYLELIPEPDNVALLTSVILQQDGAPTHLCCSHACFPEQPISIVDYMTCSSHLASYKS